MTNNYVGKGEDGPRGQNGGLSLSGGPALPKPPTGFPGVLVGTCSWTGHTAPSGGGPGVHGVLGLAPGLIGGGGGGGGGRHGRRREKDGRQNNNRHLPPGLRGGRGGGRGTRGERGAGPPRGG